MCCHSFDDVYLCHMYDLCLKPTWVLPVCLLCLSLLVLSSWHFPLQLFLLYACDIISLVAVVVHVQIVPFFYTNCSWVVSSIRDVTFFS